MIPRAILGALVGDAVGAVLEGCRDVTDELVDEALTLPGGGIHRVGRGQITDDGELILTLWRTLGLNEDGDRRIDNMRRGYSDWLYSVPFDVGRTCQLAFEVWSDVLDGVMDETEGVRVMKQLNSKSEANGALMRATAIASYVETTHPRDHKFGLMLAKEDALLSHPSPICVELNQVYVLALMLLLEGVSCENVVVALEDYIVSRVRSEVIHTWFFRESLDVEGINVTEKAGHVRWGFVLAMYFLRHPQIGYEEAIRHVLRLGGDTDTNACIVGGLVGCYQPVPAEWVRIIREWDSVGATGFGLGRWRPAIYSVKGVFPV